MHVALTRRLFVLLLVMTSCLASWAQSKTITGTVRGDNNEPLAGVSVTIKGTTKTTTTNEKGEFSIVAAPESVLRFTSVGFTYQEVMVGNRSSVGVKLASDNKQLDEVVVMGYGTQKAKDVTSAAAVVDMKKVSEAPVPTLTEALRGQIPGLNITGTDSRPGIAPSLNIRQQFGYSKDGSSPLPLVVIDDVIQLDPNTGLPSLDQFNLLDPSEVESITVLKDAGAAIYGSRASQGAIVVKTKRGRIGAPKISYSGKFETKDAVSFGKIMDAYQFGVFSNRFGRASGWSTNNLFDSSELEQMKSLNYDWLGEAWHPAGTMQHSINVSGGSDRATYFAGGSYYTQGANLGSQDYKRWTFRSGTDVKVANNLKLSATVAANNFTLEKSFTKISLNDGGYTSGAEQTDYVVLSHMPKYIPWMYNVNGVNQYISPALSTNRVVTTPSGQNNISGWNYFGLLNNGSKTTSGDYSYNANFALQYDIPFVKGLSVKATYGLSYSTDNTEQDLLPEMLSVAANTNAAGTHLYGPSTTWATAINTTQSRVSYADVIGKIQQGNFFVNYDNTFGKNTISVMGSVEKTKQDFLKKFLIYDAPIYNAYNGASTSAGTLNTSNSYVQRSEGGSLGYLGRLNYSYDGKYLLTAQFRVDASTKFAPEHYWGFFPSVSAGWVLSRENWFNKLAPWVNNLKLRASFGKTGYDNLSYWRWLQTYTYASDKGLGFGLANAGLLVAGVTPNATPNRDVQWDQSLQHNFGIDASVLHNRLSFTIDHYADNHSNMFTQMAGMVGVPISVGGAFAEQNFAAVRDWGTEISATWRDHVGKNFDYSIGVLWGSNNYKVTKWYPVAFDYPSKNIMQEGFMGVNPAWGFLVWRGTSSGDGMLRTDADINNYWNYLTDLATKAGTTPKYIDITSKSGLKKGMLAYQDIAGALNPNDRTIAGPNGQINQSEDYTQLLKKNRSYGITTNLSASYKNISWAAQVSTSWGGLNSIDYIKQGTSTGQIMWSHESYLNDMFDSTDNPNGKYPNLAYYSYNAFTSDFWKISSFRCFVRSMSLGYTLPAYLSRKVHMESLRISVSGYNLWDFYNPYPDHYRNMYDSPKVDYPTLRTWALGVNATF